MRNIIVIVLVVAALADIFLAYTHDNQITVRNVQSPTTEYDIPFDTHGGTVYMSAQERNAMWLYNGLGLLLGIAGAIEYGTRRRTKKHKGKIL